MRVLSLNWNYGMCSARYWRAGASQPSRSDFYIWVYIYTRRMRGIVGERERANLVVHLAAIFLYIYIYRYMGIYITGAAHTVIPI